jgi:hypothetical protein
VPERWFLFVQLEIPWELGPADGRYLLRGGKEREPQHVVVLNTVDGRRKRERPIRAGRPRKGREVAPEPEPTAVRITRATVVDPIPLAAESQAQAWLKELDPEHEMWQAAGVLNRVLLAQRIAAADPYIHEVSPAQALVVRAGWGLGEQVADGHWAHARELLGDQPRRQRRSSVLRPQERLTWMLGGREEPLLCEELALRARRDLDQGRIGHAAVELQGAYAAALSELSSEGRQDLALRIDELRELSSTIPSGMPPADGPAPGLASPAVRDAAGLASPAVRHAAELASPAVQHAAEQAVRHALERLEAALRARTAGLKLNT